MILLQLQCKHILIALLFWGASTSAALKAVLFLAMNISVPHDNPYLNPYGPLQKLRL